MSTTIQRQPVISAVVEEVYRFPVGGGFCGYARSPHNGELYYFDRFGRGYPRVGFLETVHLVKFRGCQLSMCIPNKASTIFFVPTLWHGGPAAYLWVTSKELRGVQRKARRGFVRRRK